jgi:Type IX secretion system membrane protein PorP/SprF
LVRSDLINTSLEFGLQAIYDNKFWLGGGYRINESITGLLGTTLLNNKLRLGYAFDFVSNASAAKSATSHEILMVYALPAARIGKKSIIRTPRYRYN